MIKADESDDASDVGMVLVCEKGVTVDSGSFEMVGFGIGVVGLGAGGLGVGVGFGVGVASFGVGFGVGVGGFGDGWGVGLGVDGCAHVFESQHLERSQSTKLRALPFNTNQF